MCYLVVVCFAVGQALAFVVTVSQERFLTLSTHKMLQANPSQAHMVSTAISQYSTTLRLLKVAAQSGLDIIRT